MGAAAAGWRRVLGHLAAGGVEPPDGAIAVARVPDDALPIHQQAVGPRALGQFPFLEGLGPGVEAGDAVPMHHGNVDVAVGPWRWIAGELGRRHAPLPHLASEGGIGARRDAAVRTAGKRARCNQEGKHGNECSARHRLPPLHRGNGDIFDGLAKPGVPHPPRRCRRQARAGSRGVSGHIDAAAPKLRDATTGLIDVLATLTGVRDEDAYPMQ